LNENLENPNPTLRRGPCGSGKSILLRTLAGAWPERWVHPSTTLVRPDSAFVQDKSDTGTSEKLQKVNTSRGAACYNLQSSALIHQSNMFFGREKTGAPEPDWRNDKSSNPQASKAQALVKFVSQTPFISGLEHLTLRQILLHDVLPAADVAQLYANPELLKILERTAAYRLSQIAEKKEAETRTKAEKPNISQMNDNNINNLTKSTTDEIDESSASAADPSSSDPSLSYPPSSTPDSQPAVGLLGFPKLSEEFVYTEEAYQRDLHIARMLADDDTGLDGTISTEFEESHEVMSFEDSHEFNSGEPSKLPTKPNRFAINGKDAEPGNLTRARTQKVKRKPPVQLGSSVALPGDSAEVAARKMVLAREATHFQAEFFYDVVCRRALRDAGLGGGRGNVKSVTNESSGNANDDSQQQQPSGRKAETTSNSTASSFQNLEPLLDTTLSHLHFSASELTQLMFAQLFALLGTGRGKYLVLDDIASCAPVGGEGERLIELLVRKLRPHQAVLVFKQAANGGPADEINNSNTLSTINNINAEKLQDSDVHRPARPQLFTDEFTIREKRVVRVAKE